MIVVSSTYTVSAGDSLTSALVLEGGALYIASGGVSSDTTLQPWGNEYVQSGGKSYDTQVGGIYWVLSGGQSYSPHLFSGAINVEGGSVEGAVIEADSILDDENGTVTDTIVSSGVLYAAGSAVRTVVSSGGELRGVFPYGEIISAAVYSGGYEDNIGGSARDIIIYSGGAGGDFDLEEQFALGSAVSSDTVIMSGGNYSESGGSGLSPVVSYGGTLLVAGGRTLPSYVSGSVVYGSQAITSGASGDNTTVESGGVERVSSGSEQGASVLGGGLLRVQHGGIANGTTVSVGGDLYVIDGGAVSGTLLAGRLDLHAGGAADATTVVSGGYLVISSGGFASGTLLSSGGQDRLSSGGRARHTSVAAGGRENIGPGGVSDTPAVLSGGDIVVSSGGEADRAFVSAGGLLVVSGGGLASGTWVLSGGHEFVRGGVDSGATVTRLGVLVVSSGGISSAASVTAAGNIVASSGGVLENTSASGALTGKITGHGNVFVLSGGIVSAAVLGSAGRAFISAGATVTGGLTISSGGFAMISGTMAGDQVAAFVGSGGALALYDLPTFAAAIGGFAAGDTIDLATLPYATSATSAFVEAASNLSGTLTITNGASSASLSLNGSYVTSDFAVTADGATGTLVGHA